MKNILLRIVILLLLPIAATAQVNGEYRSAATGLWSVVTTWETYSTTTSAWATATAAPSGPNAIVTVRNGHIVTLGTNHSFKRLTVQAGGSVVSDGSERRLDMAGDTSAVINNGNIGGILNSNDSKLNIANSATCTIGTISGTGTTSIVRIRFNTSTATVTNLSTLIIDQDLTILSSGITAYYNNTTPSNTNAENCVITINAGRTVTASGALHASLTPTGPGGNYTYNINGTLDMSGTTTTTLLHPINNSASTITINVAGTWKLNKLDATYTGANAGSVVLNILNGGLVDATKSTLFTLGSRYFIISGTGKLKRPVLTTNTAGILFPIGTSATSYNPVTLIPGTANDTFAVGVGNTLSYSIGNPGRIVNKQWDITPTVSGSGFNTIFGWQTADQASGFSQTAPLRIFSYSSGPPAGWAPVATAAPITGSGTIASPYITGPAVAPSAISGLYVVGDSDAAVVLIPTVAITAAPGTTICAGTSVTFTAATTNITGAHYQWKVNSTNVGTDNASYTTTTLSNGAVVTCVISYTVGGPAAATSNSITMTVNPLPVAGTITGSASVCSGTTEQLSSTVTGGVWSSSNTAFATVSTSGLVSGVAVGTVTINYAVTNSCGVATATKAMAVTLGASAGTLSGGTAPICPTATTTLASTSPGGVWISNNTSAATVSSGGVVTGVAGGTATIAYVVTNGCGTDTSRKVITVNPLPNAGTISGPAVVCTGSTITLTSTVSGGTWTSSNANATVSGGVVSGVTVGTSVITYTATNTCGSATATRTITISTVPTAGTITGSSSVCVGATITLVDTTKNGTWSNANGSILSINGGVVTGIAVGSDVVSYTVANTCGTAAATKTITVGDVPAAATVAGPDSVCVGSIITLTPGNDLGIWSSATKKTVIATDGIVTGLTAGTDTIYYSITNLCGTTKTMHVIEVWNCNPLGIGNASGKAGMLATAYPNPSSGSFIYTLSSPRTTAVKIIITNMMGAMVGSVIGKTNERISVNLNGAAGIYFVTAITDEGRTLTKVHINR